MMALCRSVIEGGQIALPLTAGMDEMAALKEKLPGAQSAVFLPRERQGISG